MSAGIDATIHRLLQNLDSERGARQLFGELNYENANDPVLIPSTAAFESLAEAPQVIAKHGDFKVIYTRLASKDRLLRSIERPIIEQLLRDNEYSLFLFSDDDASHWDLVNVKLDPEKDNRRIHRRISIGPEERSANRLRTASEQMTTLFLANDELDQLVQRPLEIQRRHDLAFEVEKVTRRFYEEYAAVFRLVKQQIEGIEDGERLHFFAQRLFNRLMFLAFVQKKDWLKLDGDTDYLNALWRAYRADPHGTNFYNQRLHLLFFSALEILKPGGALAFISSNKWFKANYGTKLREHIARTTNVLSITDFGDLPVFESAAAYPMIFIAHKQPEHADPTRFTEVTRLDAPYPDVKAVIEKEGNLLPPDALEGDRWLLADEKTVNLILTMERETIPLGKYVDGQIYYGVKTGFNTAFVIDGARRAELIDADPKSAEIIKPLAVGRDIRRWHIRDSDRWLIYVPWDLDIRKYPAIWDHLSQWKSNLEARPEAKAGRYHWWCMARYASAYADAFDKPKILLPDMASEPRFAFDPKGEYSLNTTYLVVSDDPVLLAVLNSDSVLEWFLQESNQIRGGYIRFFRQHLDKIPVPNVESSDRNALERIAEQCIAAAEDPVRLQPLEAEMNERVEWLYSKHPRQSSHKSGGISGC